MARKTDPDAPYWQMVAKAEKDIIEWALGHPQVNSITDVANLLGVSRPFLYKKLDELGMTIRLKKRDWRRTWKERQKQRAAQGLPPEEPTRPTYRKHEGRPEEDERTPPDSTGAVGRPIENPSSDQYLATSGTEGS